jgi:hypothetical protein
MIFIIDPMLRVFLLFLFTIVQAQEYTLELFINNQPTAWQLESGVLDGSSDSTIIGFEGGKLELNPADWNTFEYAHVLATTFNKTSTDTYTVSATIRHHDTGWDNYADAFEVKGNNVQNGLRILAHPHENEQPFTRSQSGVVASGLVWIEAKDNVEGISGSKIYLDLSHSSWVNQNTFSIHYTLSTP